MALFAGNVKLSSDLSKSLNPIRKKSRANLSEALGEMGTRAESGRQATGRIQGSYAQDELAAAGDMAGRRIDDTVGNVLGTASLQDFQNAQEHERQMALAKEIGDMFKPNRVQEIARFLGHTAESAPAFRSLYDTYRSVPRNGSSGSLSNSLSMQPYSAYGNSYQRYGGGGQDPRYGGQNPFQEYYAPTSKRSF
jgi:hypothetical protein